MVDRNHTLKGEMVTTLEKLEGNVEEPEFPHSNAVNFSLYYFSKMDEVHIISDIYMDEVGIPMLISMSQYTNGDQISNNGSRSIHTTEST